MQVRRLCGRATTLVGIVQSKELYKDKAAFNWASFFVAEVPTARTERPCLAGLQYWNVGNAQNIVIHSTKFRHFRVADAATSHYLTSDINRTFHGKKCYELTIEEMMTSAAAFDPGTFKEFTKQDEEDVRESLTQVLESFTFLK